MSIEAMKLALEALALFASDESDEGQIAIAAHEELRQAIEQAEKQEPVAWVGTRPSGAASIVFERKYVENMPIVYPVYRLPPRRWVGLTPEDRREIFVKHDLRLVSEQLAGVIIDIEAKLKEKNCG